MKIIKDNWLPALAVALLVALTAVAFVAQSDAAPNLNPCNLSGSRSSLANARISAVCVKANHRAAIISREHGVSTHTTIAKDACTELKADYAVCRYTITAIKRDHLSRSGCISAKGTSHKPALLVTHFRSCVPALSARAATVASAESTFKSFMRQFCGNGIGICVQMNSAYCTNVGGYSYYCTVTWTETKGGVPGGFRNQYGWGHVYQTWVADYAYNTTG